MVAVAFTVRWLLKCVGRIHKWPVAIEIVVIEIHFRRILQPLLQMVLVAVVGCVRSAVSRGLLRGRFFASRIRGCRGRR